MLGYPEVLPIRLAKAVGDKFEHIRGQYALVKMSQGDRNLREVLKEQTSLFYTLEKFRDSQGCIEEVQEC